MNVSVSLSELARLIGFAAVVGYGLMVAFQVFGSWG